MPELRKINERYMLSSAVAKSAIPHEEPRHHQSSADSRGAISIASGSGARVISGVRVRAIQSPTGHAGASQAPAYAHTAVAPIVASVFSMPGKTHDLTACQCAIITHGCDARVASAAAVRGIHCTNCGIPVAAAPAIIHGRTLRFIPVTTNGCVCWHLCKHRNRDCPPSKVLHRVGCPIRIDWGLGQPSLPQPGKVPPYNCFLIWKREKERERERERERESEREKKIKAFAGKGMGTRVVSVPEEVTTQAGHGAPKMSRLRAGQAGTQAVESIFTHRYEMNPEVASRQAIFSRVGRVHQAPLTHGSDHAHLTICGHGAFPRPCCEMSGPTTDNKSDGLVLSAVGYHCTSAYARYQMSHR